MGRPGFTSRAGSFVLVQAILVLAGLLYVYVYALKAPVHAWPAAVFTGGFIAVLGTQVRMTYLVRVKRDRAALWPLFIALAGVVAAVIMMSRAAPQPLLAAGCVGIAATVAAWSVRLVIRALSASAAKPASSERKDTPE